MRLLSNTICAVLLPLASVLAKGEVTATGEHPASASGDLVRRALGTKQGETGFRADADLNLDGVVNVIDAAYARRRALTPAPLDKATAVHSAEVILVDPNSSLIPPGGSRSILFLIRSNTTPILGYSLDVRLVPAGTTLGTVSANVSLTNFHDARNLITAGGATRDPFFSVIQGNASNGVFVNTITDDDSTVIAVDGVNDVLVEVHFDASIDACGIFTINLGVASVLSDENASAIPFSFTPATIHVIGGPTCRIPALSGRGLLVLALTIMATATLVFRRNRPDMTKMFNSKPARKEWQ